MGKVRVLGGAPLSGAPSAPAATMLRPPRSLVGAPSLRLPSLLSLPLSFAHLFVRPLARTHAHAALRPAGSAKGAAVRFKVVDSVKKLEPRQYERIVCVFVHGPAWQFKGWEWKTPVDIFSK